jgi:hypothetical protein
VSNEEQDNPGIRVPPPLIYLLPLFLGLLLDKKAHVPFLPQLELLRKGGRSG